MEIKMINKQPSWEKRITNLAKEYARQSYLVSEESHPEEDEITALTNLVFAISTLLSEAREEERQRLLEEIRLVIADDDEVYINEEIRTARNRMKSSLIEKIKQLRQDGKHN